MSVFETFGRLKPHQLRSGITARVVNGERITMAVVDMDPNAELPGHHHENEQLGFVITGTITFKIGSESKELHEGDTYTIPSMVHHEAVAGPVGCTVVDVFTPVRSDWATLPRLEVAPGRWP